MSQKCTRLCFIILRIGLTTFSIIHLTKRKKRRERKVLYLPSGHEVPSHGFTCAARLQSSDKNTQSLSINTAPSFPPHRLTQTAEQPLFLTQWGWITGAVLHSIDFYDKCKRVSDLFKVVLKVGLAAGTTHWRAEPSDGRCEKARRKKSFQEKTRGGLKLYSFHRWFVKATVADMGKPGGLEAVILLSKCVYVFDQKEPSSCPPWTCGVFVQKLSRDMGFSRSNLLL